MGFDSAFKGLNVAMRGHFLLGGDYKKKSLFPTAQ